MIATDLIASLAAQGIGLSAIAGKLRVEAPADLLTDDLRSALASHKPELLAVLAGDWRTALQASMQKDFEDVVRRSAAVYEQLSSTDRKAFLPSLRAFHDRADQAYQAGSWAEFQAVLVEIRALLAHAQPDTFQPLPGKHWTYRAWSRVLDAEVWFVHCEAEVAQLAKQDVQRGSIYTETELAELLRLPQQPSPQTLRDLHLVKAFFNATVVPAEDDDRAKAVGPLPHL